MNSRRKNYQGRREKVVDFIIGFTGFFILNGLILLGFFLLARGAFGLSEIMSTPNQLFDAIGGVVGLVLTFLPILINLGIPIYFAFSRYYIAIGYASAFASMIFLSVCAGVVWTVACFVMLSNPGGGF